MPGTAKKRKSGFTNYKYFGLLSEDGKETYSQMFSDYDVTYYTRKGKLSGTYQMFVHRDDFGLASRLVTALNGDYYSPGINHLDRRLNLIP